MLDNVQLTLHAHIGLAVRRFAIRDAISEPFEVLVTAAAPTPNVDIEAIVGYPAALGVSGGIHGARVWSGVVAAMELVRAVPEDMGESTYRLRIVPAVWMLGQRRNYRVFQHQDAPSIAAAILGDWGIAHVAHVGEHPVFEYRVQYEETDLAYLERTLEEAGIAYFFDDASTLVFSDAPQAAATWGALEFEDDPTRAVEHRYATKVRLFQAVRPAATTVRDYDFRIPQVPLVATAGGPGPEQYRFVSGAFQAVGGKSDKSDTPLADERGAARTTAGVGQGLADRLLAGRSGSGFSVAFETNVVDFKPGDVLTIEGHPTEAVQGRRLLVVEMQLEGDLEGEWRIAARAQPADRPFFPFSGVEVTADGAAQTIDGAARPAPRAGSAAATPLAQRPRVFGVQTGVVVGPPGEEIHTDELGRVRVQLHWDRYGRGDDKAARWTRVSQGWAGAGYGMMHIPRVGHEVLVAYVDGNPDDPIVVGRLYNAAQPVPYALPDNKTISTWKSDSSPGSDGFNEIKFEDRKGQELVYVQAERDLDKLVKHDEREHTGHDRRVRVDNDMTIDVLRDRSKHVFRHESELTDGDRSIEVLQNLQKHVVQDETEITDQNRFITVQQNLEKHVAKNEGEHTGENRSVHVGKNLSKTVDGNEQETTKKNRKITVKKNLVKKVLLTENETTGVSRTIQVGGMRSAQIGISDSTFVGMSYSVTVSPIASLVTGGGSDSTTFQMEDKKITLSTGKASITLDGADIVLKAEGNVTILGKEIHLNPPGDG